MSTELVVLVAFIALLIGGCIGVFLPRWTGRMDPPDVTAATRTEVLEMTFAGSDIGMAVVDKFHDVSLSNRRAADLGLVHGTRLNPVAWSAAEQVFASGQDHQVDLSVKPRRSQTPITVGCRVQLLGDDIRQFVVLYATDESEHARMESTRRDFVANVSHELKTPVGAMALLAEALVESKDDPETVEHFGQRIISEAQRLGSMVTELIALSKLQGAEKMPDIEEVFVDEVIREAVRRSQLAADNQKIMLVADVPSGLRVWGDEALIVMAVTNLVANAIHYSPPTTVVSISRQLLGEEVIIRVTDRGIGIGSEHQARVFERFYRVDEARSRATGGTGLGLAIVKHVMANHDGTVELWSQPGTGSTFTLRFPTKPPAKMRNPEDGVKLRDGPVRPVESRTRNDGGKSAS